MKGRTTAWLCKKAKRGFRGYPIATLAFYGPAVDFATKVVASIFPDEGCDPDPMERWFAQDTDVRTDPEIGEQVIAFVKAHGALSIVVTDRIIGCPHEEGVDCADGTPSTQCPHGAGRDRWTGESGRPGHPGSLSHASPTTL
ncbi:hypothetical protein [Paludibaculum fermentans]|uniref:hypothetical protein n=1 Tax=Paludibaculum fermentans TaxID=1473598 RepID=UPI003EB6D0CB